MCENPKTSAACEIYRSAYLAPSKVIFSSITNLYLHNLMQYEAAIYDWLDNRIN